MAIEASLSPRTQRVLVGLTILFGLATLGLAARGLWLDRCVRSAHNPGCDFDARTKLALDAVALLAFEPPSPAPTNDWFSYARIFTILFAAIAAVTIVLSVSGALREFVSRAWIRAWSRLWPGRSHTVIFGLGRIGFQLVRDLRTKEGVERGQIGRRRHVIVVEKDETDPDVNRARRLGALVLIGDVRERTIRRRAYLHLAREVFVVAGDDAVNIDIAGEVLKDFNSGLSQEEDESFRPLRRRAKKNLQCYVHVGEPAFSAAFATHRLLHGPADRVDFHVFNVVEQVARDLLLDSRQGIARKYPPREVAHYFVFGFGQVGQTVALQMARLAHFNTFRRLRLTLVDDFGGAAGDAKRGFLDRHPGFCPDPEEFDLLKHRRLRERNKDGWGCRWWRPADPAWRISEPTAVEYAVNAEFVDLPTVADAPRIVRALLNRIWPMWPPEPRLQPVLVICFDDERCNFQAAMALRHALDRARLDGHLAFKLPLYVYLPTERGLTLLLDTCPEFGLSNAVDLHVFGAQEQGGTYRQIVRPEIRKMARVVQESYNGLYGGGPDFEDLSPAFQASNVDAAAHADLKLDAIGYRRRDPAETEGGYPELSLSSPEIEMLAHMEHNRWMAERLCTGWRFGEKRKEKGRDIENQRRPSFVPWLALGADQQQEKAKDVSQVVALDRMFRSIGQVVEKKPAPRARETRSGEDAG